MIHGGALLHKVKRFYGSSFADIIDSYIQYTQNRFSKYESVIIIFDGYNQELRRRTSQVTAAGVVLTSDMTLTTTREVFLRNTRNKDQLIKALLVQLKELDFLTYQSEGDADTFIVERVLQEATHSTADVVAEDTDILILLIHHWDSSKNDVFFNTERGQKSTKVNKWWNIECFKEGNASGWMDDILFAHAWDGCGTTSAIHRKD